MLRFAATTLMTEQSEYDVLVFHLSNEDHYLTLQRRADLKPGRFGDIRLECDGQTRSGYDVLRAVCFSPERLRVSLDPAKTAKFDGELEFEVALAIDPADKPAALRFLRKFFAGTTLFSEE